MGRLALQRTIGAGELKTIIVAPNGDELFISLMPTTGINQVKLVIAAPREYEIYREEIYARCVKQ